MVGDENPSRLRPAFDNIWRVLEEMVSRTLSETTR
jgi:hypothetical protein